MRTKVFDFVARYSAYRYSAIMVGSSAMAAAAASLLALASSNLVFADQIFFEPINNTVPIVTIGNTAYRGVDRDLYSTTLFGGIPYADTVAGTSRLTVAQDPQELAGEHDGSKPGAFCTQSWAPFTFALRPTLPPRPDFSGDPTTYFSGSGSEECLTLDIYVPQGAIQRGAKLPVQVFIPGGGYAITPTLNEPDTYIGMNDHGFVSVFPRYRLGAYGLLGGSEMLAANLTNLAMRDIITAMKWVKFNIEHFGGDPNHVVMEGASAGAGAIMYLSQTEHFYHDDEPLWHGMIGNLVYSPPLLRCDHPSLQEQFDRVSRSVGCATASDKIACLRKVSSQRFLEANYEILVTNLFGVLPFGPCVDEDWILSSPNTLNQEQKPRKSLKLLAGSHVRSAVPFIPGPANYPSASDDVLLGWMRLYLPSLSEASAKAILKFYDAGVYAKKENAGYERMLDVYSDVQYNCPTYWWTEAYGEDAWKFLYAVPPGFDSADLQWFTTNGPYTPNAPDFLEDFLRAKGSFIRYLDPNPGRTGRIPEWKSFKAGNRGEMVFNLDAWGASVPRILNIPNQKVRCDAWKKITKEVPY
ncbi:hypothetical protein BOTBODRAFT_60798 [Botryobasidium botryosum FD-172 SS1]|uniref:Carboxylesterase type B domain-containing protein n=1 Tax=Botryobasidium botryosum (strain FD-172 SS1) TaxID=930990 RepID=A0A067LRZ6_BOTB1|nr:hypothetical protein BOTBODRAFT_60798 [Botryobasidium botryosum FD-172 SS1]